MRRMTPTRLPETLAFLMRRRALSRLGTIGALAMSQPLHAASLNERTPRVICVGGALTEIVYALGAHPYLVGVDSTSTFPKEALALPQVGYARSLSAEGMLALKPTHIFATEEAGPLTVLRQVTEAGVSVVLMKSGYRFEGLIERIVSIGKLLGRASEADSLTERLKLEWRQLHALNPVNYAHGPRVLFLFAHSASRLMAAGTQTGAHAMIEYAGAINAITEFSGYKPLTPESLMIAQPDVLLLTDHGVRAMGDLSTIFNFPGVRHTELGRHRRIAVMDASLLLGFGPRLPGAVEILKSQLSRR